MSEIAIQAGHGNGHKGTTSNLSSSEDNFRLASASGFLNLKNNALPSKTADR